MLQYVIDFGEVIPDQEIFNYQDLDIIDVQKLESQMNMFRSKERKLLDLFDSLQQDLIMTKKRLSKKTISIMSEDIEVKDKNQKLKEDSEIIELKDSIEGIKLSMDTVARELDFVKSDLYILRSSMYQKFK